LRVADDVVELMEVVTAEHADEPYDTLAEEVRRVIGEELVRRARSSGPRGPPAGSA
jgi:hypothetical protein